MVVAADRGNHRALLPMSVAAKGRKKHAASRVNKLVVSTSPVEQIGGGAVVGKGLAE